MCMSVCVYVAAVVVVFVVVVVVAVVVVVPIWCMGKSGPKTSDHFACCAVAQKPRGPPNQASCPQ